MSKSLIARWKTVLSYVQAGWEDIALSSIKQDIIDTIAALSAPPQSRIEELEAERDALAEKASNWRDRAIDAEEERDAANAALRELWGQIEYFSRLPKSYPIEAVISRCKAMPDRPEHREAIERAAKDE